MGESDKHFEQELEKIYKEVKTQASQGLDWANINLPQASHPKFPDRINTELVVQGYIVNRSGDTSFSIKW